MKITSSNFSILFVFLFLFSATAWAQRTLKEEFHDTYVSGYVAGKCGQNILNLIGRGLDQDLDLKNAKIIEIVNKGFSMFGMVNAEYARGNRRDGNPDELNWFHHVILEKDGMIYDYDFGTSPSVLPVKAYFEKMFFIEKTVAQGASPGHYIGREEKMKTYQVTVRPALTTYDASINRQPYPPAKEMRLGEYLK